MRKLSLISSLTGGLAIVAALLIACSGDPAKPATPGIQPEIINAVDNFQFQVTAVKNYTGALNYTWSNTGPAADVNQSCAIGSGTVTLTLFDDSGAVVYTRDLSQGGSYASTTGTAGTWHIRVTMQGVTGDLNFRTDKRTP